MLELLRDKIYIRYWLAVVISFVGDAMTITAVVYLVGTTTKDPVMISLVFMAQLLPTVVIGPMIGPLIDRYSRRGLMVLSDVFRFFMVLMMVFFYENSLLLILLVFLQGLGTAFFEPARMAAIPAIVGPTRIPQGIALFQSTMAVIKLTGPVLAGVLLSFQSPKQIFVIDSVSYLISAALVMSLSVLTHQGHRVLNIFYFDSLKQGVLELVRKPIFRFLLLLLVPVLVAIGMFTTNFKAVLLQDFEVGKIQFGMAEGMLAVGTVAGAVAASSLLKRMKQYQVLVIAVSILGVFMLGIQIIAMLPHGAIANISLLVWSLVMGMASAMITVPISTVFLQEMPEMIRGRGTAIFLSFHNFFLLIGNFLGGIFAKHMGIVLSIMMAGLLLLITAGGYLLLRRSKLIKNGKYVVSK